MTLPERILIVRLSHLGDVVHALGVFHALHEAYPRAQIGWAIQPEFAGLVDGMAGLGPLFRFGRRAGWRAWPRLRRELRAFGADLAVDAQGNLKSAAATWCSGAPRRAGLARSDWREPFGARFLNEPAPPTPAGAEHAMERMLALARHVAPGATHPPRTDPGLSPAEEARGVELLARRFPEAEAGALLFHLSSPGDVRSWPEASWATLARAAAERRPVLVLSGPAEEELGRRLARELPERPGLRHWVGQRGLRELAAVFAAAARRGASLISSDSGPMHLAAACGVAVIGLEGPQDGRRTGPWPAPRHRILRAREEPPCAPCLARRCDHPEGPVCMTRIEPSDVLKLLD